MTQDILQWIAILCLAIGCIAGIMENIALTKQVKSLTDLRDHQIRYTETRLNNLSSQVWGLVKYLNVQWVTTPSSELFVPINPPDQYPGQYSAPLPKGPKK